MTSAAFLGASLVSCIMPTANRRRFVPAAIAQFLAQDYPERELLVLDDGEDSVADLVPRDDPRVRYRRLERRLPLGAKRNLLCQEARGGIIAHWDDDDWYAPWRLSYQMQALAEQSADVCGLDRMLFLDPRHREAWEYVYPKGQQPWVYGATLCYRRAFWQRNPFPEINVGEDTRFVWSAGGARILALPDNRFFVGTIHDANTSPKQVRDARWRGVPVEEVLRVMESARPPGAAPVAPVAAAPEAAPAVPRVSIGIHAGEDGPRLLATLRAIEAATPAPVEILLLPEGPDDSLRATLSGLTHLKQAGFDTPRGAPACFNRLLREGGGEVLVFLESGALPGPGWLEAILGALAADPCNGLAGPSSNRSWNMQAAFPQGAEERLAGDALEAARRFGNGVRAMEPLYCLADFCYAVRREVVERIGGADEAYGAGPCWEMDYSARAVRAGFRPVWAQGAYVYRRPPTPRRRADEARLFEASKRLYQDRLCGLRLRGQSQTYDSHCTGAACPHFAPPDRVRIRIPLGDGPGAAASGRAPAPGRTPLVSCIMPTRNRGPYLALALDCFEAQDHDDAELLVVDDGEDPVAELVAERSRVRYLRLEGRQSIGRKRNLACREARGRIVMHWDDDDWYGPGRIRRQVAPLLEGGAQLSGIEARWIMGLPEAEFWTISASLHRRMFVGDVHGGTLAYTKALWESCGGFPDASLAEDAWFLRRALDRGARLARVANDGLFVYTRHRHNAWSFPLGRFLDPSGWSLSSPPPELAPEIIARYRDAAQRLPAAGTRAAAPP
jgi:glycosyltransferase involved in cell wall biosynthesis